MAIPDEYQHFWDYLERWACREDGWHTVAIASKVQSRERSLALTYVSHLGMHPWAGGGGGGEGVP